MPAAHRPRLATLTCALPPLLLALGVGNARALEFTQVEPAQSKLSFVSKQMGVPVAGSFPSFTATLRFDPTQPNAAAARIEVDLGRIDAGSPDANGEVIGKQWLNVKAFPTAQFVASAITPRGDNRYEAQGTLTIKGKSQAVVAPFSLRQEGTTGVFDGGFVIKRLDFGIGDGVWSDLSTVADEIEIKFHVVAKAPGPAAN